MVTAYPGGTTTAKKCALAHARESFEYYAFPYMNPGQSLSIDYSYEIQSYSKLKTADREKWEIERRGVEREKKRVCG